MPQPLSKVTSRAVASIGGDDDSPSRRRPELALFAMNVIAEWSILESGLRRLFINMLGANPEPAAAMYSSLTSTVAQRDALLAVAETVLQPNEMEVFQAIIALFSTAAKERNKIAHWVWGYDANLKDAVLLCDPQTLMDYQLAGDLHMEKVHDEFVAHVERVRRGEPSEPPRPPDFPSDKVFVYREDDFIGTSKRIRNLISYISQLTFILRRDHPANRDARLIDLLSTEPEISEVLDRQRKRQKRTQEAP